MDLVYLGHAMWLAEVPSARILFDPVGDGFHAGVFRAQPRRRIDWTALRPDLLVVSHRHPDHFDLPTLARLAALDPTTVVLTSDPLVGDACRRLGFADVGVVAASRRIPLDGADLWTSPSQAPFPEWGVIVVSPEGTCWNQVDSALGTPSNVRTLLAEASVGVGRPELATGPDLALLRWAPIQQIDAHTAGRLDFPFARYAHELDRADATGAGCSVPAAAGHHHEGPGAWLRRTAYPVSEERFLEDFARRCPGRRALPAVVGGLYRIRGGQVDLDRTGGADVVEVLDGPDERVWSPLEVPALVDPGPVGPSDRDVVKHWVEGELHDALGRLGARTPRRMRLVLRVVWPDDVAHWSWTLDGSSVSMLRQDDPEWDLLDAIAGSALASVIRGDDHWGRPLLSGLLRTSRRLYDVGPEGLVPARGPAVFLYEALPYDVATERWIEASLRAMGR